MPNCRCYIWSVLILGACGSAQDPVPQPAPSTPTPITQSSPAPPSTPALKVAERSVQFSDVAAASGLDHSNVSGSPEQGYIAETLSAGAAFFDYDNDGHLDLFTIGGTRLEDLAPETSNRLYRNVGDGTFVDQTATANIAHVGWGMGCAVGDYDNDGDVDLYLTYLGPNRLYRNGGAGVFSEVAEQSAVADSGWGSSASFGDMDRDGLLDLYVTNYVAFDWSHPPAGFLKCRYKGLESFCGPAGLPAQPDRLYRNTGAGFADMSASAGITDFALPALGVVMIDADGDDDLDLYIANDSERNLYFNNQGDWRFTEMATAAGLAYSENGRAQAGMGVDAGDYNRDGTPDLIVTNFSDDVNTLYRNNGDGTFDDATYAAGLGGSVRPYLGWSTAFFDYDNDGWLDLFVANGHIYPQLARLPSGLRYAQRNLLYRNERGRFAEADGGPGWALTGVSRAAALADYDNDGDLDLFVTNLNQKPNLLRNDGGNRNNWLGLRLTGRASNRDAIGARVTLYGTGIQQTRQLQRGRGFQSQHDPRLLFGLGSATQIDSLEINWPSGHRQVLTNVPSRRYLKITEDGNWTADEEIPPLAAQTLDLGDSPLQSQPEPTVGQPDWQVKDFHLASERYYREGRYTEARLALERALKIAPDNPALQINLATVFYAGLGDYPAAAALLERTVVIAPHNADAHLLLGKVYLRQDRTQRAIAMLRQAVGFAPQDWQSQNWLGLAYIRAEQLEAAADAFQQATQRAPWHPTPHLHLSRLFQRLERHGDADIAQRNFAQLEPIQARVEQFERKTVDYPDSVRSHALLGLAYIEQGRDGPAAVSLQRALALDSLYAPAHHGLGRMFQRRGDVENAIRAFERACALDRKFFSALVDLGQAYYQIRHYRRAIAVYRHALGIEGDKAMIHTNLAMALAMAGELSEASATFRKAIAQNPHDTNARDGLAQVLATSGDRPGAELQWREILRLEPDHARAREALKNK